VKQKVELLNKSILPKGVQIRPYYDRTWLINTTLTTVFRNLLEGAFWSRLFCIFSWQCSGRGHCSESSSARVARDLID